jgi:hypothetical protein
MGVLPCAGMFLTWRPLCMCSARRSLLTPASKDGSRATLAPQTTGMQIPGRQACLERSRSDWLLAWCCTGCHKRANQGKLGNEADPQPAFS